jgi:hypothetical protein
MDGCRIKPGMTMIALTLLAACGRGERPSRQPEIARPSARETAQCHADLRAQSVAFRVLSDKQTGAGCGLLGAVQLLEIGVPITNLTGIRCGQARAFSAWVRNGVAPAAFQLLGSELARVETFGSFACRNVAGRDRRSGHAIANAIDVAGFVLKDGRRVTILADWRSPDPAVRDFLQTVRRSACRRFGTVLSPDYNAAHANHLHLEDDRAGLCR